MTVARLRLVNFKAFEKFTVTFGNDAFLVGPNNAGKSTLISALKACAYMLQHASAKTPSIVEDDKGRQVRAYPLQEGSFGIVAENLRHEFHPLESRIELTFKDGASLTAVWPAPEQPTDTLDEEDDGENEGYYYYEDEEDDQAGFFYLALPDGGQPYRPADVRRSFSKIGVIPLLTPIPLRESPLSRDHVRANVDGRLASRHFRNQLSWFAAHWDSDLEFDDYRALVEEWSLGFQLQDLRVQADNIDLFYVEAGSRVTKEISWAGDGVQVWLQILFHIMRLEGCSTIVLDEPDVYLHPDLQRKLVRLLESQSAQTIAATHSAEMLAEAAPSKVVWVDRSRARATRAPDDHLLAQLSRSLGSQFNLRLARALRTRVALFFEGDDMRLLRNLAQTAGCHLVASETHVTCIPIEGYTNWSRVEAFSWLTKDLLHASVSVMLTLDRDYKSDLASANVVNTLRQAGVEAHIWRRHELESYLLVPSAIARISKAPEQEVDAWLDEAISDLRAEVFAGMHFERSVEKKGSSSHLKTVTHEFAREFEKSWESQEWRRQVAPAKETLSAINQRLQEGGYKAVSPRALAKALKWDELDDEVVELLKRAEELAMG